MDLKQRLRTLLFAATVAIIMATPFAAFAQDFNALQAQGGRYCATLPARSSPLSCNDWVGLATCLTQAASAETTCAQHSSYAMQALTGAISACGAQNAEVSRLQGRLASCEHPTPTAPTAAPHLVRIPICLSGPEYGNATTVLRVRVSGALHECEVKMDRQRQVLEVVSGDDTCQRIDRRDVVAAGCKCPTGSYPTEIARSNAYYCGTAGLTPAGVDGGLAARVTTLERNLSTLTERLNAMCEHVPPSASTLMVTSTTNEAAATPDGATATSTTVTAPASPPTSTNCREWNQMLTAALLGAAGNGGIANFTSLQQTVQQHGQDIATLRTDVDGLRTDVDELRRGGNSSHAWQLRVHLGAEGGLGVIDGMTPFYAILEAQVRANLTSLFSLQGSAGVLWGRYDSPLVDVVTGYLGSAGIGFTFNLGSVRNTIDVGVAMRSYADTGYHQTGSVNQIGVFGDYRGRVFGGELAWTIELYRGLAIRPSVFVGTGDATYGYLVRQNNRVNARFADSTGGITALFGLTASYGTN